MGSKSKTSTLKTDQKVIEAPQEDSPALIILPNDSCISFPTSFISTATIVSSSRTTFSRKAEEDRKPEQPECKPEEIPAAQVKPQKKQSEEPQDLLDLTDENNTVSTMQNPENSDDDFDWNQAEVKDKADEACNSFQTSSLTHW